jgi:hypothetical protein
MITTHKVHTVSNGGGESKCLNITLTCSYCCLSQASMNTLIHIVDHMNKCFEANCLGWRDVISIANDLLTCHALGRFAALCNEGYDAVEGEYYLYKNWQFLFLGRSTYIWIRNGLRVTRKSKEVTM